jgi:hypothetical protein
MMRIRRKRLTALFVVLSLASCCLILEIFHRHAFSSADDDLRTALKAAGEQSFQICKICLLARHRVSSAAVELFRLNVSPDCGPLTFAIWAHSTRDYFPYISSRAPPKFLA